MEESVNLDLIEIESKKADLENLRKEKLQGVLVRSRMKWAEEGEKPTKYFCSLESRNYINKTILNITKDNGITLNKQDEILKEVENFYKKLYSCQELEENINTEECLRHVETHIILTEEEKLKLEGEVTGDEIAFVLNKMKFFKFFYKDLKLFIRNAINEGYNLGTLSSTQRQGLVTCIPKADKPKQFIKNWRPITLLNVMYKIASGCIAERLKTVLTKLISSDQTGSISGRYIGENTRLIYDIMNITEELNIPWLLLIIDFEKRFDSISWDFINKVLKFFNFGESIIKWVSVFYKKIFHQLLYKVLFCQKFFLYKEGVGRGTHCLPTYSSFVQKFWH